MIGVIEGLAEATSPLMKALSGLWSDRMRVRKPFVLLGYGLAAATKPVFAMAGSVALIGAARIVDRVGKGIRGSPRDALIADVTPAGSRGAAYGLRQSLDTIGGILGPSAAVAILGLSGGDFRLALWAAVIPAVLSVGVIVVFVEEPKRAEPPAVVSGRTPRGRFRDLPAPVWSAIALGAAVMLPRYSDAFLILYAAERGFGLATAPLAMVVFSAAYALTAYPAGRHLDARGPEGLIAAGLAALVAANAALALATGPAGVLLGVALFGLHMGLTQGTLAALIGGRAPAELRGTAFGAFHGLTGVALLLASAGGGAIWYAFGPAALFWTSGALAAIAAGIYLVETRFHAPQDG